MSKIPFIALLASLFLTTPGLAVCADIVGTVSDIQSHPIGGILVTASVSNKVVKQAVTDASGKYWLTGLKPDTYHYVLDPLKTHYKGGNAVSFLNEEGLVLNWRISKEHEAIALASPGSSDLAFAGDPLGLTASEFTGLVLAGGALVGTGVVGGVSAAGGFSNAGPSGPPASPSR